MELVEYDGETVTIRMNIKKEYSRLLAIVGTVSSDYGKLDKEMLSLSESQVEKLAEDLFSLDKKIPV